MAPGLENLTGKVVTDLMREAEQGDKDCNVRSFMDSLPDLAAQKAAARYIVDANTVERYSGGTDHKLFGSTLYRSPDPSIPELHLFGDEKGTTIGIYRVVPGQSDHGILPKMEDVYDSKIVATCVPKSK